LLDVPCARSQRLAAGSGTTTIDSATPHISAGFTLIEVLTLLAVLGIVTAFAAPRLDFQRFQIGGAMQSVGSTLMAAQRQAVQEQHDVVVAFDVAGSRLRIHSDANNDRRFDAGERVRYEPLGEGIRFGRGGATALFTGDDPVSFTLEQAGLPAVMFYRNGAASEEGGFYLTSVRAATAPGHESDTRALRIERSTGRPTWFRHEPPLWTQEF
jgi:type II secretory pathway pseudopilin PulG